MAFVNQHEKNGPVERRGFFMNNCKDAFIGATNIVAYTSDSFHHIQIEFI